MVAKAGKRMRYLKCDHVELVLVAECGTRM